MPYEPFQTASYDPSTTPPVAFTPAAAGASSTPPTPFTPAAANPSTTAPVNFTAAAAAQSTTPPVAFATPDTAPSTTPPTAFNPAAGEISTTPPTPFATSSGNLPSEAALVALPNASLDLGSVRTTESTIEGESIRAWVLKAGVAVAVPDAVLISVDYDPETNARFWERLPL